jgi:hypothetical protein
MVQLSQGQPCPTLVEGDPHRRGRRGRSPSRREGAAPDGSACLSPPDRPFDVLVVLGIVLA